MKNLLMVAAMFAALVAGPVTADEQPRQITVTGEGRVETAPDMAVITLGVTHEDTEARAAMSATSDAVGRVLARLESAGIERRDLQTQNLSLNPVWSNRRGSVSEPPKISGFVASNTVLVRVRDLDALGGILDAVIADGANDFNGLSFGVQEPGPLRDEARKRAVADAMSKAKLLAEAAGISLGRVMSMSEQGGGRPMPMAREMAAMSDAAVPVAAGEVSLAATVTMVFEIAE